ncbi:hypothetical protein BDZ97DRAFT_1928279 [Flammula alnicola]|nr:hypothetical protein BDZ97DRAFT_1928279 [Flammula alnicola]
MHPFGGTPICPRCSKAVYLAEQAMGPGRKLYHKPCLACTACNKRLDSFTLLEHDQQPYCKSCHLKNFGTRDLRHANLPYAQPPVDEAARSTLPISPSSPNHNAFPPQALLRPINTGSVGGGSHSSSPQTNLPRLRPNRSLVTSPISPTFPPRPSPTSAAYQMQNNDTSISHALTNKAAVAEEEEAEVQDVLMLDGSGAIAEQGEHDDAEESLDAFSEPGSSSSHAYPSHTGRPGIGTIPRTIPLYLNGSGAARTPYKHHTSHSVGSIPSRSTSSPTSSSPSSRSREAEDISFSGPNNVTPLGRNNTGARFGSPGTFSNISPLKQTATGTRYGIVLSGGNANGGSGVGVHMTGTGGSPRKWGAGHLSVLDLTGLGLLNSLLVFITAEDEYLIIVKAVGKTFHKNCLRCTECNSSLDSNRLRDHDGDPFCVQCYGKNYGPQGGGYALLGKAGG